ncbi:MAG: hypothetical protein ACK46X_07930 [Candidatus Sericytochromatia bacterium]
MINRYPDVHGPHARVNFGVAIGAQQLTLLDLGAKPLPAAAVVGEGELFLVGIPMMEVQGGGAAVVAAPLAPTTHVIDGSKFHVSPVLDPAARLACLGILARTGIVAITANLTNMNSLGLALVELACVVLPKRRTFKTKLPRREDAWLSFDNLFQGEVVPAFTAVWHGGSFQDLEQLFDKRMVTGPVFHVLGQSV